MDFQNKKTNVEIKLIKFVLGLLCQNIVAFLSGSNQEQIK